MSLFNKLFGLKQRDEQSNEIFETPPSFFYFYFPEKQRQQADEVATILKKEGFDTEIHKLEEDVNPSGDWTLKAIKVISFDEIKVIHNVDDRFYEMADKYGIDYDGHEVPMIDS